MKLEFCLFKQSCQEAGFNGSGYSNERTSSRPVTACRTRLPLPPLRRNPLLARRPSRPPFLPRPADLMDTCDVPHAAHILPRGF